MSEQPPWSPYEQQHPSQYQGQPFYQGQPLPGGQAPDPGPGHGSGSPFPPRRKRHLVRNILAGIGAVVVVGIVISIISSHGSGVSTTPSDSSPTAGSTASPAAGSTATRAAAHRVAHAVSVGSYFDVQDSNGHTYRVTLVKIIDPAKSANKANTPDRGNRLVGAVFRIKALSGSPRDENADADAVVIGSNGQTYTFDIRRIAGYTNFSQGMIHVAQHETTTGAVTFQLPDGIKVMKVQWTAGRGLGSTVQWNERR